MQIDWITVAAQIVNFLVLVWLLQHFLYGPITRAMDRREQRIADRLRDAADQKDEAEAEAKRYREQQQELDKKRDQLIADAREEAEQERNRLRHSAQEEIDQQKQEWLEQLHEQRNDFLREIRQHTNQRFIALSQRAVADLANAELEAEIAKMFVRRLHELDKESRRKFADACDAANEVTVDTGFELSPADRRRITRAVHDELHSGVDVEYRQKDEVICGISLHAGSQTLSWSVSSYFDSLEDELAERIENTTESMERQTAE